MFAILISEENVPEIIQTVPAVDETPFDGDKASVLDFYLDRTRERPWSELYYLITGYVTKDGRLVPWAILPKTIFDKTFEYDPHVIPHNWDQIVRK